MMMVNTYPFSHGHCDPDPNQLLESHRQANPGSIRIETRNADPGSKQDLNLGLRFAYNIAVSLVRKVAGKGKKWDDLETKLI